MIVLGLILSVFAIGFFCWLLFTLAVYALPCFVGMTAGFTAYHHGYDVFESGVVAILVGALTLAAGQVLFAWVRRPLLRAAIALLFAAPAAVAGYHATLDIAHIAMPHDTLSAVLAYIGATLVGATAWARIALFVSPAAGLGIQDGDATPSLSLPARN